MSKFVKVSYRFYKIGGEDSIEMMDRINTQGFTLYNVLSMLQANSFVLTTSIKLIRDFCKIEGLMDKRVIQNYLLALKRNQLIECEELTKDTKLNDTLIIKVLPYMDTNNDGMDINYSQISCALICDKLSKIGHIGFSIYCFLHKNHNKTFGNQMDGNYGFANPSREYIANALCISIDSVKKYCRILEDEKLIKIEEQPKTQFENSRGCLEWRQNSNHYFVKSKYDTENKYYIGEK